MIYDIWYLLNLVQTFPSRPESAVGDFLDFPLPVHDFQNCSENH